MIALRAGDSVRLCEHVQRSFAKTLPFDRLGTDGRAKGKIGEGGRERGNGRTNHTWASRGGISCSRFSNLVTDETQKKRCLLETSSLLPPLKSSQFASMPKPGCTCSHMHGAVVKVHWAKEGKERTERNMKRE